MKKTNETKETDQEVDRYFAKLRQDKLRVKGSRNPNKEPKRVISVQARLNTQRKAKADQAKSINGNRCEVKILEKIRNWEISP